MSSKRTLICCALPFGYGPAAKLLTLVPLLRRDWRLIFVGHGIAWELASRCGDGFERMVEGTADCPIVRQLLGQSDGLLSVMDRDSAVLADGLGKPSYVVDSLLWMRDQIPSELNRASIYWAQRFADLVPDVLNHPSRPALVGPIVSPRKAQFARRRLGLLINLGGCQAAGQPEDHYRAYAGFVVTAVVDSGLARRFSRGATIVAGAQCAAWLRRKFGGRELEILSLSPADTLARIRSAAVALTAPGLTTTLECFRHRTATFFLPPQNYSQWCVLQQLNRRRLAPLALDWQEAATDLHLKEGLPESARNRLVQRALERMTSDAAAARELAARLKRIPLVNGDHLVRDQSVFFRSLGPNGCMTIASQLRRLASTSVKAVLPTRAASVM